MRSPLATCRSRFGDSNRLSISSRWNCPTQASISKAIEKELILRALRKFDWNQTHAARFLDLSRKALIYRMEKFGLRKEQQEGSQPGTKPQR